MGREPDLSHWLTSSERAWQSHLRALCASAPPSTVSGVVLRWAKESLVLAGYDRGAIQQELGIDLQSVAVKEHLARCAPVPSTIANASFSSTFRKPMRCLSDLDAAARAPRPPVLSKNAPEFDAALRTLVRDDASLIAERVPDIDRIAALAWSLDSPQDAAPPPEEKPVAPSPRGKRPRK